MASTKRVYQIDLFRFLAAVAVVLYHYTALYPVQQPDGSFIAPLPGMATFTQYGYLGVDLFFIISGFVIALSIKKAGLRRFVRSRISRLYPAYWVCLVITFFTLLFWGAGRYEVTWPQLLANATMLNGITKYEYVEPAYWSLFVEIKFYFLIAAVLLLQKVSRFRLGHFTAGWLALSVLYVLVDFSEGFVLRGAASAFILSYSPLFIAGMMYYRIYKKGVRPRSALALAICIPLSIYHALQMRDSMVITYGFPLSYGVVAGTLLLFHLLIFLSATHRLQAINSPVLLRLGVLTYPLYLLHQSVGYIIFDHLITPTNTYWLMGGTVLAMIAAAYVINVYLEVPLSARLKQWLSTREPAPERSPVRQAARY